MKKRIETGYDIRLHDRVRYVHLIDVYTMPSGAAFLYEMLSERDPAVNISHNKMPTYDEHLKFVASRPYKHWWVIRYFRSACIGVCYVTKQNEIGIFLRKKYQGQSLGEAVIWRIMIDYPQEHFLANIAPGNERSINLFKKLGFRHIQNTYRLNIADMDQKKYIRITENLEYDFRWKHNPLIHDK